MAITVVQHTCSGQSTASSTTNTVAVANNPTVGNYLILIARWGTSSNNLSSVSDTVNTWTVDKTSGNLIGFASCKVVGSLSGKSITTTFSGSDSNKGMYVFEVSPGAGNTLSFVSAVVGAVFFNGINRNCQGNTITPQIGDLMLAGWADSSAETSLTAGSGFTDLPSATGPGYFSTASIFIEGVYEVAASTTATQLTATAGSSPTAYSYIQGSYRAATPPASASPATVALQAVKRSSLY